jgi:hypothetical protein
LILLELVDASIREGIFPSKLKKSVVKPIYKNGGKEAINYRQITLVPTLSEVLEKVIANQLIAFLFGFRKNESANDAIAKLLKT